MNTAGLQIALLALLGLALACVPNRGGWNYEALADAHPALGAFSGQRLGDATPYPIPLLEGDPARLGVALCRWRSGQRVRVSAPGDANARERTVIELAVEAWASVDLGIELVLSEDADAEIEIFFLTDEIEEETPHSGEAETNCSAEIGGSLVNARVGLARALPDVLGRSVGVSYGELLGTTLHELGHALGYQGHAAKGPSVMVRNIEQVRRLGEQVFAGEGFADPTLSALYAVPGGEVLGELHLDREQTLWLRIVLEAAREKRWRGPFARVGDRAARVFWLDSEGEEVALGVRDWAASRRHLERLRFRPNLAAINLLKP